jgi:uncharacterized membrane protein YagU involved in acid resistance
MNFVAAWGWSILVSVIACVFYEVSARRSVCVGVMLGLQVGLLIPVLVFVIPLTWVWNRITENLNT